MCLTTVVVGRMGMATSSIYFLSTTHDFTVSYQWSDTYSYDMFYSAFAGDPMDKS